MIIFYMVLMLPGIFLLILAIYKLQQHYAQRKIIVPPQEKNPQHDQALIDYRGIIITNSPLLSFLQRMDSDLSLKLRILAIICVPLLLAKIAGWIPLEMNIIAIILILLFVAIILVPGLLMGPLIKGHVKKMMDALPYFVDLIAVCIQAGMTVETSIKFIATRSEDLNNNMADLLAALVRRAELSGMEEALLVLYHSMDVTEMRMFGTTLQQSVHYGTSLYENLMELSKDIRELQLLDAEEKIGKLSAKMSVPLILFIMFPLTILIAAPGILRILKSASF